MLICLAFSLVIANDRREVLTCDERFLVSLMRVSSCVDRNVLCMDESFVCFAL